MDTDTSNRSQSSQEPQSNCSCFNKPSGRREFLARTSYAVVSALAACGISAAAAQRVQIAWVQAESQKSELSYAVPLKDEVSIDKETNIILIRWTERVFAFSMACPHQSVPLQWRQKDLRFQCPKHNAKYRPDGTFMGGHKTRNMDRFALRLEGERIIVDQSKRYQSDRQKPQWDAASVAL